MSISRRRFLVASASLPGMLRIARSSAVANQADTPKIGDMRGDFDAWFGPGTETDGFISYPPLSVGRASYHVAFNEESLAETIVGDFNNLAGGGIEFNQNEIGYSQYVPTDAVAGVLFMFGFRLNPDGAYGLRTWNSPQLASETGGSGTITVLDRYVASTPALAHFKETIITTDTVDAHPIIPTSTHIGPHSGKDAWEAYPGGVGHHQAGFTVWNPSVSGSLDVHPSGTGSLEIIVQPSEPLAMHEAANLIASMLPPSELVSTTWFGTTPVTDAQIRIHHFQPLDAGREIVTAQFVTGDEADGTVSQLFLTSAED